MHKGVICLTKATDKDEAISNVESFLESYGDGKVWDWYVIGGRWSGTLNAKNQEFQTKAAEHFKAAYPNEKNEFLTTKMVEEQAEHLQAIWTGIGGTGNNPYARSSYDDKGQEDDAVPLTDCIAVVNEWKQDLEVEADQLWEKMVEARNQEKSGENAHGMSGYYANRYAEARYDSFCFDSNVFDIDNDTNNPEEALKEPEQYFAVMVDMHN